MNQTAIFVYSAFPDQSFLEKNVPYDILPKKDLDEVVDASMFNLKSLDLGGMNWWLEGYSVYFPNDIDNAVYDISFLDLLNE